MDFIKQYLKDAKTIIDVLDLETIEKIVKLLRELRNSGGRLFILGVGGGAGHASHAVNDFRKICQIEAYSPVDNVSELTARANDEGWDTIYINWLKGSKFSNKDMLFVFSVGGGSFEKNISTNIIKSLDYAKKLGAKILGVVGRDGGYTAKLADACVIVPVVNSQTITAHTEGFQAVVWHLLVSHPELMTAKNKWESVSENKEVDSLI